MTIHWKAVEQCFTVVLFVFQFASVCNFGKFINFGLVNGGPYRGERDILLSLLVTNVKVEDHSSYKHDQQAKKITASLLSAVKSSGHLRATKK